MVVAPVLLVASTSAYVLGDGLGEDSTGAAIQVYAAAAFGLALFGLTARLTTSAPRLGAVLLAASAVGTAGAVAWGIDSLVYSYAPASAASEQDESIAAQFALFLPGIVFPLTMVALGLALARTGAAKRLPALLLALGAACFPVSRIGGIEPLALIADLLILGGMAPLGWSMLRSDSAAAPLDIRPLAV
jgi:hypothetical protein